MKNKNILLFVSLLMLIPSLGCTSKENLKTTLKNNPDILVEAIEANPDKIIMALNKAAKSAQEVMAKNQQAEEAKALEASFEKPLEPTIRADEHFRGPKDAPLTLVIYSDFECPYCSRGFKNENEIAEKFKGKIRIVFKHLPLPMHPQAMVASKYYEAVRLQDGDKASKLHDFIFSNQRELQKGEEFLKSAARKVGADMGRLAKDVNSDAVKNRIQEDMAEADKFGIQGTPGYILNGVPVRGAYPTEHFIGIVEKLKEKGKVQL